MKKRFSRIPVIFILLGIAVLAGCMSAQQLIERGDTVSAIEKLSKSLSKKSTNQKDADLFVSVYPSELERRIEGNRESVRDVIDQFVESHGASSQGDALNRIKGSISGYTFLAEESSVRSTVASAEAAYKRVEDLYRIQKAVKSVPVEIGDPQKGTVYLVEKYYEDYVNEYNDAKRDLSGFLFDIAETVFPGDSITIKKKDFDLYEKAGEYNSNILSDCKRRQAQLAYEIGDQLKASSNIQDKKDAIEWFKKCDRKVSGYSDVNTKILGCNYDIATIYLEHFERTKSRQDIREAINYFSNAKTYSDAVSMKAYCESLLYELDNPKTEEPASTDTSDIPVQDVTVTFGDLVYSDTTPVVTMTVRVAGADHLLSSNEFKVTKSSSIGDYSLSIMKKAFVPGGLATYVITFSDIIGSGYVTVSVLNKNGSVLAYGPEQRIDKSKVYVAPMLSKGELSYSKTDSDVTCVFNVSNLKKTVKIEDIIVNSNKTGSTFTELTTIGKNIYGAVFSGVTESGSIVFSVIGDDGSPIKTVYDTNQLDYFVNSDNIYVAPSVSFGSLETIGNEVVKSTVKVKVSGINQLLDKKNFKITTAADIGSLSITPDTKTAPKVYETVTYLLTFSNVRSSGTMSIAVSDNSGKLLGTSRTYNLSGTSPVNLTANFGNLKYSSTEPTVTLEVNIPGLTTLLKESNFKLTASGSTGTPYVTIPAVKAKDYGTVVYTITVPKIASQSNLSVSITDPNGKAIATNRTFTIDYSKVYKKPVETVKPVAKFGSLNYSTTEPTVTLNVGITGLNGLLEASNFKLSASGNVGTPHVTMEPLVVKSLSTYTITVPKVASASTLTVSITDLKGNAIVSNEVFVIDYSKVYKKPVEPVKPVAKFGSLNYSTTEPTVTLGVNVTGLTTVLRESNFKLSATGNVGTPYVSMPTAKVKDIDTITYTITVPKVASGSSLTVSISDSKGNVIVTKQTFSIDYSKVYKKPAEPAKPVVRFKELSYSPTEPTVSLGVNIYGLTTALRESNFKLSATGNVGTPYVSIPTAKVKDIDTITYTIIVPKVASASTLTVNISDSNGRALVTNQNIAIDYSKVYKTWAEVLKPKVSFGGISYSKTLPVATFPISVSGLDYILSDSNFDYTSKGIGSVKISPTSKAVPKAKDTVTYTATVSNLSASSGTLAVSVKDKSGNIIGSSGTMTFNSSSMYREPTMSWQKVDYNASKGEAILTFSVDRMNREKEYVTLSNLTVIRNSTGGKISEVRKVEGVDTYAAILTGATKSGVVSFRVTDESGNYFKLNKNTVPASTLRAAESTGLSVTSVKKGDLGKVERLTGTTNVTPVNGIPAKGSSSISETEIPFEVNVEKLVAAPTVTFGSVTFSQREYLATFPVTIKGLNYVLGDANFVKESQGGLGYSGVTVKTNATNPSVTDSVVYTVTVPGGDRKFKMTTKDRNGNSLNVRYFEFTDSQFPAKPWVQYVGVSYSKTTTEVYLDFSDNSVFRAAKNSLSLSDISVTVNDAQATIVRVEPIQDYYRLVLNDVKQSGTVRFKVKGANGNFALTSDYWCDTTQTVKEKRSDTNTLSFKVDSSKVYKPAKPTISGGTITYSPTANIVYLAFEVSGVKKQIAFSDISITANDTEGVASELEASRKFEASKENTYRLVLKNVQKSGNVEIRVKGDNNEFLGASTAVKIGNLAGSEASRLAAKMPVSVSANGTVHYSIDAAKVTATRTVTYGSVNFSKTKAEATFTFTVKGVPYILGNSNFNLKDVSGLGAKGVTIRANSSNAPKLSDPVVYTVTVPGGDRKFDLVLTDNNGKEIDTRHFTFTPNQFYQAPRFEYFSDPTYSNNSTYVSAHIYVSGLNKVLNGKDMNSVEVVAGPTASAELSYVSGGIGAEAGQYEVGLTNVRITSGGTSGTLYIRIKGDNGQYIDVSKYKPGQTKLPSDKTLLPISIDTAKMALKPTASFHKIAKSNIGSSSVTFKVSVWGITYLLNNNNFVRELTGTVGIVSITTARKTNPTASERVEYTVSVTGLDKRNDGSMVLKVKDNKGNIIGQRSYYFDPAKLNDDEQEDDGELLRLSRSAALNGTVLNTKDLKSKLELNSKKTKLDLTRKLTTPTLPDSKVKQLEINSNGKVRR